MAVLTEPRSLPSDKYDVVVIGAGIGGLTAAALLAKTGLDVCVLEMASHPGGCCTGFERNGFHFETAVHWLNQCGPNGYVRRIFDLIAPGAPRTSPNSRIRRFLSDSRDYLLTNNPDEMRDRLIRDHANEARAICRFFEAAKTAAYSFSRLTAVPRSQRTMSITEKAHLFAHANWSALPLIGYSLFSAKQGLGAFFKSDALSKLFSSEERLLSCLLPVGWAYENDYQLPPSGGSRRFAQWLCSVLGQWGSCVAFNCRVVKVLVGNGAVTGVRYEHKGETRDIQASYVIAACDVESLYSKMLDRAAAGGRAASRLRNAELFSSCATLSLGLDCPASQLGLHEEQIVLKRDALSRAEHGSGAPQTAELSIIAASERDASLAPAGKGSISVYASCSIAHGNYWEAERDGNGALVRGKAYQLFKQKYADALVKRLEDKLIARLRDHIEILDIATPLTYLRYTGNRDGAIMGFRPNMRNIRNRVASYSTPVRNLFVGGQWAELGGGVPVAVRAGMNSALLILKREAPEAFRLMCDVIDNRVSPNDVSSPCLRTLP
jgi:phytoene dehydrogenase-like protein